MKSLFIAEKYYTPQISFDVENKLFEISGESFSEYSMEFYEPVLQWLEAYTREIHANIVFNFKVSYFNTSSSRRLYEIFKILDNYHKAAKGYVKVHWYCSSDDMDMIEAGEDFQEDFNLPFEIVLQKRSMVA
ncbi:MAG TPA: hypothetical protein DCS93_03875 [Microscillaceae bacterium]|nr:hypothetical protein [Microscillaceae bacterium]